MSVIVLDKIKEGNKYSFHPFDVKIVFSLINYRLLSCIQSNITQLKQ